MNQRKNRIFLIPEAVYDERTEAVANLYGISKALYDSVKQLVTGHLSKQELVRICGAYQKMNDNADVTFAGFGFPDDYFSAKRRDMLEPMKAKEVFVYEILNMCEEPPAEDDEQDGYGDDDDYFDYDAEETDCDGGLTYMEVECMCDRLYELKEDAANSVVQSAELLKTTDELLEALEEIKYRLDR